MLVPRVSRLWGNMILIKDRHRQDLLLLRVNDNRGNMILIRDRHSAIWQALLNDLCGGKYDTYKESTLNHLQKRRILSFGKYDTYKESTPVDYNISIWRFLTREI